MGRKEMKAKPYYETLNPQIRDYRLECTIGNSQKYYELYRAPTNFPGKVNIVARHGRIGTNGRTLLLEENVDISRADNRVMYYLMQKLRKGYINFTQECRNLPSNTKKVSGTLSQKIVGKKKKSLPNRLDLVD